MELSFNLGLPATPLSNDPRVAAELVPVYNAIKNLALLVDSLRLRRVLTAYEDITAGYSVGIYDDSGIATAKLAEDGVLDAIGFATTSAAAGSSVEIQCFGLYPELAAGTLTIGAKYYQSATPGVITATPATQCIGIALSDTQLLWMPQL